MVLHRLGEGAEDDADLRELLAEGRRDRDRVEDRVHRDAGQLAALAQRNAELLVGLEELRVHLLEALRAVLLALGAA